MNLRLSFFTTYYLSNDWFPRQVGLPYIVFQIVLTGSFIYFSYWLYKKNTPKNLNKKWYRNLLAGSGGRSVEKALKFYKEIEEFENDK